MKCKNSLFSLLIIVLFCSCDMNHTIVTPVDDISTEAYSFSGYSDLIVSHAFKVEIYFSDSEESITIEANENLHQYIKVIKDGYSLHIGFASNIHIKGNATLKAYITTRSLSSFSASGASRIVVEDLIKESDVKIDLSGASYFNGELRSDDLNAELSGASEASLSGFSEECSISASGASKFEDYSLTTDYLYGDLSGASKAYITINKEISVQASGASNLYYKGQAFPISQDLSGGSKIIRTD